jgi:hypothetical protein
MHMHIPNLIWFQLFYFFFDSYEVKMASIICDVDDTVKESSSSSSTSDSQMPLIEDQRSETATTSTQIHDLTDEHDLGNSFLQFFVLFWFGFFVHFNQI